MLVIENTTTHPNSTVVSGCDLYDLSFVLNSLLDGEGHPPAFSSGFGGELSKYYRDAFPVGMQHPKILHFDGSKGLAMDHSIASQIVTSKYAAVSLWIKFSAIPDEIREKTYPIGTIFSTRADYTDEFDYSNIQTFESAALFNGITGFSLGYTNTGTAAAPIYKFVYGYGPTSTVTSKVIYPGRWYLVTIKKDNALFHITINGTDGTIFLGPPSTVVGAEAGKLIIGASITGSAANNDLQIHSLFNGLIANLAFWNGPLEDFPLDDVNLKNYSPVEFYKTIPNTLVKSEFYTGALADNAISSFTNFYKFSPNNVDIPSVEESTIDAIEGELRGKENQEFGYYDSTLASDVWDLDGKDDYLIVSNQALNDSHRYYTEQRGRLLFDFNSNFTLQFWFQPNKRFHLRVPASHSFKNFDSIGLGEQFAMSLFNVMPWETSSVTASGGDPVISGDNMVGFDISFGIDGSDAVITPMFRFIGNTYALDFGNILLSNTFGTAWPWFHFALVFDIFARKATIYITEHGQTTPTTTAAVPTPTTIITLFDSLPDLTETTGKLSPQDADSVSKSVSDIRIGARYYLDSDETVDFFNGSITDLRLIKRKMTLDEIDLYRYEYVS